MRTEVVLAKIERQNMKSVNRVLAAAAVATLLGIGSSVRAQVTGDDGIAASPKVRAQMNERRAREAVVVAPAKATVASTKAEVKPARTHAIVASPKVAAALAEREASGAEMNIASTTAAANDGIVASPKVRAQLNERGERVEIAPVK